MYTKRICRMAALLVIAACQPGAAAGSPPRVRVEITSFDAISSVGDESTSVARFALPGLLASTLAPYRYIQVVTKGGLGVSSEALSQESETDRSAEFSIRGSVEVRGEFALVNILVANRLTKNSRRLGPIKMPFDRMNISAEDMAFVVAREIARQKRIAWAPRMVVLGCVHEQESPDAHKLEPQVIARSVTVARQLAAGWSGRLVSWRPSLSSGCIPTGQVKDLARRENASALVLLSAKPQGPTGKPQGPTIKSRVLLSGKPQGPIIKSSVYIVDGAKTIPMPDIPFRSNDSGWTDNALMLQFKSLFGAMLTSHGEWDTNGIPTGEIKGSEYLDLADKALAVSPRDKRDDALAEYFLMMAVARSAEIPDKIRTSGALQQLAQIRIGQERLDEASALLKRAGGFNPRNYEIRSTQAELDVQRGEYDDAVRQYRGLITRFPDRREPYRRLAILLSIQGDYAGAKKIYLDLLKGPGSQDSTVYRELAKLWDSEGKDKEAIAVLEQGIRDVSSPDDKAGLKDELARYYVSLGQTKELSGQYDAAVEFYSKSIATELSVQAYFRRGGTYSTIAKKNDEKSKEYRENALEDYKHAAEMGDSLSISQRLLMPEYVWSRIEVIERLTLRESYPEAVDIASNTLEIIMANKDTATLEPVVRLIRLAARLAQDTPGYRQDVEFFSKTPLGSSGRYSYGPYSWSFGTLDKFVTAHPTVSANQKLLYEQISNVVQGKRSQLSVPQLESTNK